MPPRKRRLTVFSRRIQFPRMCSSSELKRRRIIVHLFRMYTMLSPREQRSPPADSGGAALAPRGQQAKGAHRPLAARPGTQHRAPQVVRPRSGSLADVSKAVLERTEEPRRRGATPEVRCPAAAGHFHLRRQRPGAEQRCSLKEFLERRKQ